MKNNNIIIREIQPQDNKQIEQVIRACFIELNMPLVGTAYEDPETKQMFEAYANTNETYFVLENGETILGGAGIKPLSGLETTVCELQKMYFSSETRGLGYGKKIFQACLDEAKRLGYKQVYIETIDELKAAIHVYENFGFTYLDKPMGNTGHFSCGIWMVKDI
ncbi:GNAT family N-acetyltransferase [Aurantibacter sp.]|uniref:GNAT family N-acetyltransferase n=1 Tax=Aurantibacter sp. TaxID=2807103 RepID=UPI0035C817F4